MLRASLYMEAMQYSGREPQEQPDVHASEMASQVDDRCTLDAMSVLDEDVPTPAREQDAANPWESMCLDTIREELGDGRRIGPRSAESSRELTLAGKGRNVQHGIVGPQGQASQSRADDEASLASTHTAASTHFSCCLLYTSPSPRDRG